MNKTELNQEFKALWNKAKHEGLKAGKIHNPTPMNLIEVGLNDRPLENARQYHVPEGLCGFAWLIVRKGNSKFANWLKKNQLGNKDSYHGGVRVWISEHGQSYERKCKHAESMQLCLREGLDRLGFHDTSVYAYNRLD